MLLNIVCELFDLRRKGKSSCDEGPRNRGMVATLGYASVSHSTVVFINLACRIVAAHGPIS